MSYIVTRGLGGLNLATQGYGEEGTPLPDPGAPIFIKDRNRELLQRGIRWTNVPGLRGDLVERNGTRVEHINTLMNVTMAHSERARELSGVIRYRFRPLPSSIVGESRNTDRFGNPIFPFTGL